MDAIGGARFGLAGVAILGIHISSKYYIKYDKKYIILIKCIIYYAITLVYNPGICWDHL